MPPLFTSMYAFISRMPSQWLPSGDTSPSSTCPPSLSDESQKGKTCGQFAMDHRSCVQVASFFLWRTTVTPHSVGLDNVHLVSRRLPFFHVLWSAIDSQFYQGVRDIIEERAPHSGASAEGHCSEKGEGSVCSFVSFTSMPT